MFQGRKNNRISRILLAAVVAMFLTGVGLVLVPGAGATRGLDNGGGNNCTNNGTGIGTNSDKAKGAGEDKNCGTTSGGGNGGGNGSNDGDNDGSDNGGGNDCTNEGSGRGDAAVRTSDDEQTTSDDEQCADNDGSGGEDNDGDADDGGATGPTGSSGNNGNNGANGASGVTTSAPKGVQQVKSTSSSHRKSLACTSRRRFVIRIRYPHGEYLVSAIVSVNGKRVKTMKGNRIKSTITLIGLPRGTARVRIRATTNTGRVLHGVRTYHTCVPRHGHTIPKL